MKKILCCIVFFTSITVVFSLDTPTNTSPETESIENTENDTPLIDTSSNLFFQMGTLIKVNTYDDSAPSPILFSLGVGYDIPITSLISCTPQIHLFTNYYLWDSDNEQALPAAVENRTASVPAILLDVPATFNFTFGSFILGVQPALSFLLRYAYTAHNVTEDVSEDISNINSWFYSDLHFFYPSLRISFDHFYKSGIKIGLSASAYVPISSFTENNFPQNFICTISSRLFFPQRK
ncbi:MAG: hypothetical protein BKP49_06045 [Treponema sp. CETP13]|nr:MAG: hypothetical protein BKP49_06045 [Treponema sp. CETP13]